MAAGDRRITGSTSGDVRVTKRTFGSGAAVAELGISETPGEAAVASPQRLTSDAAADVTATPGLGALQITGYAPDSVAGILATLSGTILDAHEEAVAAGGLTAILTLTGATYTATLTTAIKNDFIDAMVDRASKLNDDQLELVRAQLRLNLGNIVRTSATVVTITLVASAYDILMPGDVEFIIPASALA